MTGEGSRSDVVRRDRFSGGPAREFLSSMAADERIFEADLAVDRAHVVMLAEQGIIDEDDAEAILSALADVEAAGFDALPDGEDVHAAIETAVIDRVGDRGGRMHTARSRNDEVATCIRYRLREDLLGALEAILALREVLLDAASEHDATVMPGHTHLQPAQPTTVGHWLHSYEGAFARDAGRLLDAIDRVNRSPLGGAAFAGTPFPIDRERTAALLGFDGIVENAADAAASRDVVIEAVGALATAGVTLSGLAEDVVFFSNKGFLELDDDYASTSSIMPQKKNPDTLELVRATAGDAAAGLNGLLTTTKGLPRAYNRDLQRATPHAWAAVDAVTDAAEVAAGALATATWNEQRLAAQAGAGFSTATGVADRLAMAGVPFRTAHELVATAAEIADEGDGDAPDEDRLFAAIEAAAEEVLAAPLGEYVDEDAVRAALDPARSVEMRDSRGGPAPTALEEALATALEGLAADRRSLEDRREALGAAAERLESEVNEYA